MRGAGCDISMAQQNCYSLKVARVRPSRMVRLCREETWKIQRDEERCLVMQLLINDLEPAEDSA